MRAMSRLLRRFGSTEFARRVSPRLLPPIDRALHRVTGGRVRLSDAILPVLMLTTTGRRSGRPRTSPLTYVAVADGWAVVGTNFGQPHHPAWALNLLADPRATVEVGGNTVEVVARRSEGDERRRLFARFVAVWPDYASYVSRVGDARAIHLFVLDPLRSSRGGPPSTSTSTSSTSTSSTSTG